MNTSTSAMATASDRSALLAQHLELMLQQAKAVFGGNFLMASFALVALWSLADHTQLLVWAGAIFVLTALRMVFVAAYHRRRPARQQAARWAWMFAASSVASGIAWGSMALLFFDTSQPLSVLFVCWALAGMTTAAVPTLSNFMPAYVGFAVPALLPYAIVCLVEGGTVFTTLGLLTFYFLGANLMYARTSNRTTGQSIQLRFENLALLEQLQYQKDRAESANAAKTKFLAAASHDLRQPTHALALFIGTLEKLTQRDDRERSGSAVFGPVVSRMRTTLKGMSNLLNSLLDASRLEAGAVPVELVTLRVQELFDRLNNEFQGAAREKGLELRFQTTALIIRSDAILLARILSNFMANAVKYTRRGRIVVGCRRRGAGVEIQVHDTGIGIAPEHQQAVFEEFVQLDNSARNREQGLGLGLSIVSRVAQLLNHPVRLRSTPGKGTMVSLTVPRASVSERREATAPVRIGAPQTGTVIVMDDDTPVREALGDLLGAHGYDVIAAAGLSQAREQLEGRNVTALMIFADYRLGENITGVDAIRAVQPLLARPAPAVIVTGDTSPDRIREAQASGYPLLHKPLEPSTLLALLQQADGGQNSQPDLHRDRASEVTEITPQ